MRHGRPIPSPAAYGGTPRHPVPDRLLRLPEVLSTLGISRSRWWLDVQRGEFPTPIHLTARTTAWLESDIAALIERAASRREDAGA